jgi:hypothetical protein
MHQSLLMILDELKYWGTPLDPTAVEEAKAACRSLEINSTGSYGENELQVQVEDRKFSLSVRVEIKNSSRSIIRLGNEPVRIEMPWANVDFRLLPAEEARVRGWYALVPCGRQFPIEAALNEHLVFGRALRPSETIEGLLLGEGTAATSLDFSDRERVLIQVVINTEHGETYGSWVRLCVNRLRFRPSEGSRSTQKRRSILEMKDPVPVG